MSTKKYVIGLDYGSDSCRALIVDAVTGEEQASSVKYYPRWMKGLYCQPTANQYRQHPKDYTEVMEASIKEALSKCDASVAANVVGISFDTTGSTPVLTDANGTPLALLPEFEENPNAMFVLWKDHTALKEADEINALAAQWEIDYTAFEGGIYSSEWFWAKVLHVLRSDEKVRNAAYSVVEHCDWLPALITGETKPETMKRSRCAAGHKAMWSESWNGLPSEAFLTTLDPLLTGYRDRLFQETFASDTRVGYLTEEWAKRLGLTTNVAVGVGAFDCHMGAVGAEIVPNTWVRVIGTSTCDIMIASYEDMKDKLIPGICGQVDGSVVPGYIGLEAGQSAFGDIYAWFKRVLAWPLEALVETSTLLDDATKQKLMDEALDRLIPVLSEQAAAINPEESTVLATDWMNGRRTPDASQWVQGSITGLNLGTTAPMIFRALVEATAFGSRAIADRYKEQGVRMDSVIGIGGISLKSPFVMQTMANVLNKPIKVAKSDQACAFGASMFAAVVAGVYTRVEDAQKAMGQGFAMEYVPQPDQVAYYEGVYQRYLTLGKITEEAFYKGE
ncbi:MAG: ribulokinase [Bacteroidales bacterium]|nr:ribulokinase [Bacteroidales bacterium]MDD4770155.1 ribulokinase [Bacteroidales bacterium]